MWLWETGSCDNSFFQDVVNFVPLDIECVRACVCMHMFSCWGLNTNRILCIVLWMCWKQLACLEQIKYTISSINQQTENDFLIKIVHHFIIFEKNSNFKLPNWDIYIYMCVGKWNLGTLLTYVLVIGIKVLLSLRQCGVILK